MIHLEVIVADTADLLDVNAYGAGALLRWESSADVAGPAPYVEGGTVALVTGTSLYDVWDAAGTTGTWYRTRVSDAGGTTFSTYSAPFQTAEHGLYLSLAQLRAFVTSSLSDEALLILLDAAAQEIVRYAGSNGSTVETLHGHGHLLLLSRPALSITSVIETTWGTDTTLAANDYALSGTGMTLRRLSDGTNPRYHWAHEVTVTYTPVDDTATRQRVQLELVKLSIAFSPGLASQTIGTWSETYQTGGRSEAEQRAAILASLHAGEVWIA